MVKTAIAGGMILAGAATFAWAQEKAADHHFPGKAAQAEVIAQAQKAANGLGAKGLVSTPTHKIFMAARYGAAPELHEFDVDIFIVQEGTGTLQVGGELLDKKSIGPGEMTGSGIKGGVMMEAAPGDVFHVPKATPHMWHVPKGQRVSYVAVKVTEK